MQSQRKTCTKCGETKPLDGFYKNKGNKYGVDSWCKPCRAEQLRRYREANREELAEYQRRYREENPEKVAEQRRRYREENREELVERSRRYHWENREKSVERSRRYREANREELAEQRRRYREENREELVERSRRHYRENREIVAANNAKRLREGHELSKMFATVPPHTPYIPGEDALILADNGMTMYQKALELGRTVTSVRYRRQRLRADREPYEEKRAA